MKVKVKKMESKAPKKIIDYICPIITEYLYLS